MKRIFLFALGVTIIAGIITFVIAPMAQNSGTNIPSVLLNCEKDSDCFPGECCHPNFCVNEAGSPDCSNALCTQECRKGTMDCGCGSCACVNGKCTVKFVESDFCSGAA